VRLDVYYSQRPLQVYSANKNAPTDYTSGRDAKAIVDFAMKEVQAVVSKRSGGASGGGAKPKAASGGKPGPNAGSASAPGGGKSVVTLTADNFDDVVLGSNEGWIVEVYGERLRGGGARLIG
jgi:hypothetical protein